MKDVLKMVMTIILVLVIAFGCHAGIVWLVCKIMGWTFAWKWVFLLMIVYGLASSIARKGRD